MELSQKEVNEKLFDAITCIQNTLHSMKTMLSHRGDREVPEFVSNLETLDEIVKELSVAVSSKHLKFPEK
ncbi:MAG: hypothetical protein Q8933_13455 [Bacteroidota bacterium]|jgi:hypothetical protein|nr:hypothetical protein [Bacteroidota bacterium]MDP4190278.1 hypothetical protein [Bacteroidota bacterium]MDP4194279.1 hypothetical protein [Bacteroidota bacterium]